MTVRELLTLSLILAGCRSTTRPAEPPTPPLHVHAAHGHEAHANAEPRPLASFAEGAVLLGDLGTYARPVTTTSAEARAFFDQGLALTYGFNHDEAARSFARAAELDPDCALCYWGVAYTLGPNYNLPMLPDRARAAWEALEQARRAASKVTPVEAALVHALGARYTGPEYVAPEAMPARNVAFAEAMAEVARRFPDDLDVQVLYAESRMNTNPWKLWTPEGEAAPGTEEIVTVLEGVLARNPDHPGANHYYIHAIEASKTPARALPSADRLGALVPGAGHLVHMPAHIYQRVGRYHDAVDVNRRAADVDRRYLERVQPPGHYALYLGHNYGFLAYAAAMEGRSNEALAAARSSAEATPRDLVCTMPGMDFFLSEPLLVMVRFGRFDEILATPKPDAAYQALVALWHHARGMAFAGKGQLAEARTELDHLRALAGAVPEDLVTGLNRGALVLELAVAVVEARIAEREGAADAIARWERAVDLEDRLAYNEPADWFYPVRHYLGAALLDAGRAADAEAVYRADLERNPDNGWALFGVWQAHVARKQKSSAAEARQAFERAWQHADIELVRTAF